MRVTVACLLMLIALHTSAAGAVETQVVLVLDSSTSMWWPLDDGVSRFAAARLAIEAVATALSPKEGVQIGLRVFGSDTGFTDDAACDDTRLVFPPGVEVRGEVAYGLGHIAPSGARPLVLATVEAVADLSGLPGRHRIVLVTAGDDTCSGDRRRAAEALGGGAELRIVGVGLSEQVEQRFTAIAPTRNATTKRDLTAALRWAVFGPDPPTKRYPFAITFSRETPIADVRTVVLTDPVSESTFEMHARDDRFEARVPRGIYNATITDEDGSTDVCGHISVSRSGSDTFRLETSARPPVTLEVLPDPIVAGGEILVHYWGASDGNHWIEVATPGQPLGLWTDRASATGPTGEVVLQAPVAEGPTEIRILDRQSDGVVRLTGRASAKIEAPQVSLDPPESVVLGTELAIGWQGPDYPGDHLIIAPARGKATGRVACDFTSGGSPALFRAPSEEGRYAVHYVSGLTARTLATAEFNVTHTPVQLRAPDRSPIGGEIVVEWQGPARVGDSVTLAVPDSPSGEYLALHPVGSGSPAVFTAPREPGRYEIRYIKNLDASVEGSTSIEVFDLPVSLSVPERVKVGSRFEVAWQGPDGVGDFISIAPRGSRWKRKLDWAFTAGGSPASLAAPFSRGTYEVRYISGSDSRILEAVPISVE
jgi:Ca-activated chloride channel family protein